MNVLRIATVSDGPAGQPTTNSGVALGLTSAFERSPRVELVATIDSRPAGVMRLALSVATFRPSRSWWWFTYNFGPASRFLRSKTRDRAVRRTHPRGDATLVVHIRNIYLPSRQPYIAFIDSTTAMAARGWKAWSAPNKFARRAQLRGEREYFSRALVVCTAGPQAAASVVDDYGISKERVYAIGGGVNFHPLPNVDELKHKRTVANILWVGLDYERKGGDILVRAFRRLRREFPQASLKMIGVEPQHSPEPGVQWLGVVSERSVLAEHYSNASIFCLPARHEPYGLVVQEAMAFALPCVVSDTGALASIVGDGGVVLPRLDEAALEAALRRLLNSADEAESMGVQARLRVEMSATWDAVAGRMIDAVEQVRMRDVS